MNLIDVAQFTVHSHDDETWELGLDGILRQAAPTPCVEPATTSSAVDASGRVLLPDGTLSEERSTPFGCPQSTRNSDVSAE